jgi:putative ABC transport system substrate-binding protein
MKSLLKLFLIAFCVSVLVACKPHRPEQTTVGIVLPLEHAALQEIVAGFSETLSKLYNKPIVIKVSNAQGDANIQRAIIQQMRDENFDLIVPVATNPTQMAMSMVQKQPLLGLAADLPDSERHKKPNCNIAIVHDEIPPQQLVSFIHAVYPKMKNLVLIHSTSDKIYPDVKASVEEGKKYGMTIKPIMVATLPDLYSSAQSLPENTQAIFVLKDNLIVSGIGTLTKLAKSKHIPLITSDQGSVQGGASFALGVHEKQIGIEGAKLAVAILQGANACSLPTVEMTSLTVFLNPHALEDQDKNAEPIVAAAKKLKYRVEII